MANNKTNGYDDEEMTVELELDDGQTVNCAIITILTVKEQDYIVLLPLDENGNNDDEYDMVADAFDEYLDNAEFDEIVKDEE